MITGMDISISIFTISRVDSENITVLL